MGNHEINIQIDPQLEVSVRRIWFKNTMNKILAALNANIPSELGLFITSDATMQQLNKSYRDKDEPTDVLAFSMVSQQSKKASTSVFVAPPDGIVHLGEIIISYPQALAQAATKRHGTTHELLILMIHGVLHLLGYDHEQSKAEARRMRSKEKEIEKKLA